ncbi:MAG: polysaccharide biosynthesis protein, partial [Lachnospiraceae bacterium]|nr:polysaccharide biosynthesis protein [Lachnospiraceae bacterium]
MEEKQASTNMDSKKTRFKHWEFVAFYLVLYDILAVNFAYFMALWLRFDLKYTSIPADYLAAFLKFAPVYTFFCLAVFFVLRLYKSLWRFAGFSEFNRIFVASVITTVFHCVGITVFFRRMPIS